MRNRKYMSIPEGCNQESHLYKSKEIETPDKDTRGWNVYGTRRVVAETPESCGRQLLGWLNKIKEKSLFVYNDKKAFTLIELLVAVLIIGILAAVAVPQYQVAVTKTHFMDMVSVAENIAKAQEIYFMENATYTSRLDLLSFSIPTLQQGACINAVSTNKTGDSYVYCFMFDGALQYVQYYRSKNRYCRVYKNMSRTSLALQVCKSQSSQLQYDVDTHISYVM